MTRSSAQPQGKRQGKLLSVRALEAGRVGVLFNRLKSRQHQAVEVTFGCACYAHDEGCAGRVWLCLF